MNLLKNNLLPLSNCLNLEFRNFFFGTSSGTFKTVYPYARLLVSLGSRGNTVMDDGSTQIQFRRGMWLLIPPYLEVRHFHEASTHLSIHFSFSILRGTELLARQHRLLFGKDAELMRLTESLTGPIGMLSFINGIQLLCRKVLFEVLQNDFPDLEQLYCRFVKYAGLTEYLHRHPDFHMSVTQMAQFLHMGTETFAKRFSADMGIAPRKFFERILADRTVKLLTGTDLSIKEIAEQLGFANEYYFSRFFKRHLGAAPTEFRRRMIPFRTFPPETNL